MSQLVTETALAVLGLGADDTEEQWHERALCPQTDPDAFYPEKGGSTEAAKAICRRCPVKKECLDFALDNDERFGIWGGFSERERREIKRGRVAYPYPAVTPDISPAQLPAAAANFDIDQRLAG